MQITAILITIAIVAIVMVIPVVMVYVRHRRTIAYLKWFTEVREPQIAMEFQKKLQEIRER